MYIRPELFETSCIHTDRETDIQTD